jgi:hypothetical protein
VLIDQVASVGCHAGQGSGRDIGRADMPKAKKSPKKTRSVKKDEYCTFIVEITDWELPYLFSLNHDKYPSTSYSEYLHLEVKGIIRQPVKYDGKEIKAIFIGNRDLVPKTDNARSADIKPNRVGTVTIWGDYRDFTGSLPFDSLPTIASMLESNWLRFVQLHGRSPYRGNAAITSIHFMRDYDPDEW